ncbi:MAG: tRNA (adenosine(37)-N6)-dimethylallyltransferase MiaA [Burkholderiales bacterium]|jgi:tRNA dimethylallyltransferase
MRAPPVVLLMGPTAVGKSAVALALAERVGGEIVSVDSAQVYRGMDIGTAKPGAADRARVVHHLVDIVDPDARYSAAQFAVDARAAIAVVRARGATPILAGGTMLYFKALREGLSALPAADAATRAAIDARAAAEGWPALHAELAQVDPVTAARIAPQDGQRIQRALEVWTLAGVPMSRMHGARDSGGEGADLGTVISVALLPADRPRLHAAIAIRFDAMLAAGLIDEVAGLRRRFRLDADLPSMRAVGYRHAWAYLDGDCDAAAMRSRGIAATRQLAKRQFTWLRRTQALVIDPYATSPQAAVGKIASLVELSRA